MPWPEFNYKQRSSLPLPWWFPLAIAEKFGFKPKVVSTVEKACLNNDAPYAFVNGYVIDRNTLWPTLPSLTSDDRYTDHHW